MRINPPTLFWILVAAIVAVDRFLPLTTFAPLWLPWCGAVLAIAGIGVSAAAKRHVWSAPRLQRVSRTKEGQLQPCIRPLGESDRSRAPMDSAHLPPHHFFGLEDP